jgi:hypothetical protein
MPDTVMNETTAPYFRNRSNDIAKLAGALALAQKAFAPIPKDREVTVTTQTGGSYKFKYATLDAIRSATMPALSEQGLALVQAMVEHGNGHAMETTLFHSSGEWVSNVTPMLISGRRGKDGQTYPPSNQELGSAQSYARRYGLSALLCITADEDDDGNTADGNHIAGSERVAYPKAQGGGTDFRPPGPRRFQGNGPTSDWVGDAKRDGIVDETRAKGTLPGKPNASKDAIKLVERSKKAIAYFKDDATTPEAAKEYWSEREEPIAEIESAMPTEYERMLDAYNACLERKSVRAV